MAIDFPNSPVLNDTHTSGSRTWIFDGEKWLIAPTPIALDDLSDVDLTTVSPLIGDVLTYDGANWVSASVSGDGGGLVSGDVDGGNLLPEIYEAEVTNYVIVGFDGGML